MPQTETEQIVSLLERLEQERPESRLVDSEQATLLAGLLSLCRAVWERRTDEKATLSLGLAQSSSTVGIVQAVLRALKFIEAVDTRHKKAAPGERRLQSNDLTAIQERRADLLQAMDAASHIPTIARAATAEIENRTKAAMEQLNRQVLALAEAKAKEVAAGAVSEVRNTILQRLNDVDKRESELEKKAKEALSLSGSLHDRLSSVGGEVKEMPRKVAESEQLRDAIARAIDPLALTQNALHSKLMNLELELKNFQEVSKQLFDRRALELDERLTRELKATLDPRVTELTKELDGARQTSRELASLKGQLESVMGNAPMTAHAQLFKTASESYNTQAKWWLGLAAASVILLVVAAFVLHFLIAPNSSDLAVVAHATSTKIVVVAALATWIGVCVHAYRKNSHNSVVNSHRANALNSYFAFASAAHKDPSAEKALLAEAARLIYAHRSSGFHATEAEDDPKDTLDLFRLVMDQVKTPSNGK